MLLSFCASALIFNPHRRGSGHGRSTGEIETQEVVISATKTAVPVNQVTSAVEVITGEEMQRRKVKTVVDALRLSQGTHRLPNGGPGTHVEYACGEGRQIRCWW